MSRRTFAAVLVATFLFVVGSPGARAAALSSAFTFQGQLAREGVPYDGSCLMEFQLWNAATDGASVGDLIPVDPVTVTKGLFQVELDFAKAPFTDEARWLEVSVQCDTDPALTPLTPRQALTATPFALQTRGIVVDADGQVGVRTATPLTELDVRSGSNNSPGRVMAANRDQDTWVELWSGFSDGANDPAVIWAEEADLRFGPAGDEDGNSFQESMRILANGDVAIGTEQSSESKLRVFVPGDSGASRRNAIGAVNNGHATDAQDSFTGILGEAYLISTTTKSSNPTGVKGVASGGSRNRGIEGEAHSDESSSATGIAGDSWGAGHNTGVRGVAHGQEHTRSCTGVYGLGAGEGSLTYGVKGEAESVELGLAYGVRGSATGAGTNYAVFGRALGNGDSWAGYFEGNTFVGGSLGIGTTSTSYALGVSGDVNVSGRVFIGGHWTGVNHKLYVTNMHANDDATAVYATVHGAAPGTSSTAVVGSSGKGTTAAGTGISKGLYGQASGGALSYGVYGLATSRESTLAYGVFGEGISDATSAGYGVYGKASGDGMNWAGYFEGKAHVTGDLSVSGAILGTGGGGLSLENAGGIVTVDLFPESNDSSTGEFSNEGTGDGIRAYANTSHGTNWAAVYADNVGTGSGVFATSTAGYAGYFSGDVEVTGTLTEGGGSFKIDHPLDPENKYLYHSFVESPDMMNIYNGNVVTDANGYAVITLPDYFASLNRDFRYQLTVIGQFAQAIVAEKIRGDRFSIRTDKANVEVSWQVTGVRKDAWANANRIPVEQEKAASQRGQYLHPEAFGLPASAGLTRALKARKVRGTTPSEDRKTGALKTDDSSGAIGDDGPHAQVQQRGRPNDRGNLD